MEYKNLLIQGGACCGKTYEAKRLACCAIGLLTENDRLNEQQFKDNAGAGKQIEYVPIHEEYEYSLFVQGIEVNAVNGNMIYKPIDRVFVDICKRALSDSNGNEYVIILDDIDRVNIMSVFGELLYAVENRNEEITLQSGTRLTVPDNLVLIVTMTSISRNSKPDYAFLRRFEHIQLFSDISVIEKLIQEGVCAPKAKDEYNLYNALVSKYLVFDIKEDESYYLLGHGLFLAMSEDELNYLIRYKIIPILEQYLKDGIIEMPVGELKSYLHAVEKKCMSAPLFKSKMIRYDGKTNPQENTEAFDDVLNGLKTYQNSLPDTLRCIFDLTWKSKLVDIDLLLTQIYLNTNLIKVHNKSNPNLFGALLVDENLSQNGFVYNDNPSHNSASKLYSVGRSDNDYVIYKYKNSKYILMTAVRGVSPTINYDTKPFEIAVRSSFRPSAAAAPIVPIVSLLVYEYYQLYRNGIEALIKLDPNDSNLKNILRIAEDDINWLERQKGNGKSDFISDILDETNLVILSHKVDDDVHKTIDGNTVNAILKGVYNMSDNNYKEIMDVINIRQMILQGPPGTSKTYGAKMFLCEQAGIANSDGSLNEAGLKALQIMPKEYEDAQENNLSINRELYWDIVQFHPSYGYEDFIRGITVTPIDDAAQELTGDIEDIEVGKKKITINAPKAGIKYETVNKILGKIAKVAECVKPQPVYLIIDEINRANVSTVFGELIYALEYRGESVATPYKIGNDSSIMLPKNLYIIGTMNTADRSIGNIDYAVRRRFLFFPMLPNKEILINYINQNNLIAPDKTVILLLFDKVSELFDINLNEDFNKDDVQVGHTMFLAKNIDEMKAKFIYQILPILREYYKDGILVDNGNARDGEIIDYLKRFGKKNSLSEDELWQNITV